MSEVDTAAAARAVVLSGPLGNAGFTFCHIPLRSICKGAQETGVEADPVLHFSLHTWKCSGMLLQSHVHKHIDC